MGKGGSHDPPFFFAAVGTAILMALAHTLSLWATPTRCAAIDQGG